MTSSQRTITGRGLFDTEGSAAFPCGCCETHSQVKPGGTFSMTFTPCSKHAELSPILHYVRCIQAVQKIGVEEFIRRVSVESGNGDKVALS